MPQERERESGKQRVVRGVILLVGAAAQAAGIVGGLSGAIDRPVIALMVAAVGCATAVSALVQMVATDPKPVALVLLAGAEPLRVPSKYRPGLRTLAALSLVVAVGAFGWYARSAMAAMRGPAIGPAVEYDAYPRRYLNNALVESDFNGRLSRFTTYTGQILDEDRLDYGLRFTTAASISRRNEFYGPTTLDYQTFAIEFDLQAREAFAPVKVEAIRVVVDAWEPLPNYAVPVGGGPATSVKPFYMYYAILERPSRGATRKLLADLVAVDDTPAGGACAWLCLRRPKGGEILLTADERTPFLVKVEPREPGFYGFDIEVMLSSGLEFQRFVVASFTHVLFY